MIVRYINVLLLLLLLLLISPHWLVSFSHLRWWFVHVSVVLLTHARRRRGCCCLPMCLVFYSEDMQQNCQAVVQLQLCIWWGNAGDAFFLKYFSQLMQLQNLVSPAAVFQGAKMLQNTPATRAWLKCSPIPSSWIKGSLHLKKGGGISLKQKFINTPLFSEAVPEHLLTATLATISAKF